MPGGARSTSSSASTPRRRTPTRGSTPRSGARFRRSAAAAKAAINIQDREWLAARVRVCRAVYHTGGTIDLINIARCQLDESTARLHQVTGTAAPIARLPQTDSVDLSQLAYYTTPGGTRIAEIDTQATKPAARLSPGSSSAVTRDSRCTPRSSPIRTGHSLMPASSSRPT